VKDKERWYLFINAQDFAFRVPRLSRLREIPWHASTFSFTFVRIPHIIIVNVQPTHPFHPTSPPRQYRTRTMLCMPIRDNYANVVAVVQAINKLDGVFTMTDELLLTSVAIQARFQMAGNHFRQLQASMLVINHHAFSSRTTNCFGSSIRRYFFTI
jgi:hypothetical protein